MSIQIVVNGAGAILGRLASYVAKQSLLGKKVIVVNCNEVLISGDRSNILKEYLQARRRGRGAQKGPNFPRLPERVVKRTIRGMLVYTQQRGLDAFKRVLCYNETPKEFENVNKISIAAKPGARTIKLSELSKLL